MYPEPVINPITNTLGILFGVTLVVVFVIRTVREKRRH